MKTKLAVAILTTGLLAFLGGCVSYYRVTDPVSGKVYYTDSIETEHSGAIRFKDEVTQRTVTLQQSEVMEINKEQFDAAGRTREFERPSE